MRQKIFTEQYVVREAIVTAFVQITTATTKGLLLAGDTANKMDLIQVGFSNDCAVATTITLIDDGTTVNIYPLAASTAIQHNYQIPIPQSKVGGPWEASMASVPGATITVTGLFIKR